MADTGKRSVVKVDQRSVGAQQGDAIDALLRAPRVEAAAAMVGISESTLRGWLKEPAFKARYEEVRQAALEESLVRLEQITTSAVEALARNLTCGVPAVEVEAAKAILGHTVAGRDRPEPGEQARNRRQGSVR
jgi:hypothetical protein